MNAMRFFLLFSLLLLAGCFPEERVWWSPQGDRALVCSDGRLYLADTDGRLGEALMEDASMKSALVKTASWLRDGSGFVAQRTRVIPHWDEVRMLIPTEEVESVEAMLPVVLPLLEAATRMADNAKTLEDVVSVLPDMQRERFGYAVRRVFEQDPAAVEKLLRALPEGGDLVKSMRKPDAGYAVGELCLFRLREDHVVETRSLVRSLLKPVLAPRVSPRQDALAFLRLDDDGESAALEVMMLDGTPAFTVAHKVSAAFDWTPDGLALVFMAPLGGEGEKLHSIHRISVFQEGGEKIEKRSPPVTLATAITLNRPVVQVLADGRVLFASQPVTLPATGTGPELSPRLFVIAADGSAVTPIPTAPGDLPVNLGFFTASPDGKRVAVVESETDAVAVVEIDTGKTLLISPPHPRWQCRTMPAWKSATELTFAALHNGAPAWMLWREGEPLRCISESWPKSSTAKWLEQKNDNTTNPAPISKPDPAR